MRKNKRFPTYLDGFAMVYRPNETNRSNFGAKTNIRSINEMEMLYKLAYEQTYKRIQDLEFAESMGKDLTLKIRTRLVSGIKNSDKVVINGTLYDIIYLDEDKTNKELYLYLEEGYVIE